jgi:hypothetical protein
MFWREILGNKRGKAWIVHIHRHELSNDASVKTGPDIGPCILGLVDLTFFQLCDACRRAKMIDDVDFGQTCLSTKHSNTLQNCFQANKPIYLLSTAKKVRDDDKKELDDLICKKIKLKYYAELCRIHYHR